MARNPSYRAVKFIDSTYEVLKSYNRPATPKRKRTKLSENQLSILEEAYTMNHHPSLEMRQSMASKIGIPAKNVQIWFQNRRAKDKSIKEHLLSESRKKQERRFRESEKNFSLLCLNYPRQNYGSRDLIPMLPENIHPYESDASEIRSKDRRFYHTYDREDHY